MKNEPRYYIRNKTGQVCGVFVAKSNETNAAIGYSLCNSSDTYNKTKALEIAFNRAESVLSGRKSGYEVPYSLRASYNRFFERCERYYKGKVVIDCNSHPYPFTKKVDNSEELLAEIV